MGDTAIAWTNKTWNPVTGCSHVSEGCRHCYAETMSLRMGWSKEPWTARHAPQNVKLHPERLRVPETWRKPARVFVNSMSDLFHEQVPDEFIDRVFRQMAMLPRHSFQVLTKRAQRMRDYCSDGRWCEKGRWLWGWPLPNVWLGVSAEDQATFDERVELLGRTPAAVRFVSAEPLLGPIDPGNAFDYPPDESPYGRIDWLIVGGESGPGHRVMEPWWIETLVQGADVGDVAVFVKQDSGIRPGKQGRISAKLWARKEWPQ